MRYSKLFMLAVSAALYAASPAVRAENVDLSTVPDRNTVQLTIYNSEDLTLVRETRKVSFKPGANPTISSRAVAGPNDATGALCHPGEETR